MTEKIYNFFNSIFSYFTGENKDNNNLLASEPEESESSLEDGDENNSSEATEEKLDVAKRTLMTRLYSIEQEISVFEDSFPNEYNAFLEKINNLRDAYNSSLDEVRKLLTFEIDPDSDTSKLMEVISLEKAVKRFIESEVKFDIISKRLQRLIKKLNILYNVSIFHFKEEEKAKICFQLSQASDSVTKIAKEFQECYYIVSDKQLKERIIDLISYVDYEIFKSSIRNSNKTLDTLIDNLVTLNVFDKFDYKSAFTAFIKDEITDLAELFPMISDAEHRKIFKKRSSELLMELTYSDDVNKILDTSFWNNFLDFESNLLELLKANGVSREKTRVKLIVRMNINVNDDEVLVQPSTTAYLSLISLFSTTHDNRILILMKLLKNVSKDVTYKEIYFLAVLFDALEVIQSKPNGLASHMENYIKKYPYDRKTIIDRKKSVITASNKKYVVIFVLDDHGKEIVTTLESLNIDFIVNGNNVLINSFYFNGLDNVLSSLETNTQNI